MDVNLHTMLLQNVPSIELNRRLLQNEINGRRVAQILVDASQPDSDLLPVRNHSRTTSSADAYNSTAAAIRSAAAVEYVTTARYTNGSVNSNLAPNRTARRLSVVRLCTNGTQAARNSTLNRTISSAPRAVSPSLWNSSLPFANRSGVGEGWNASLTMTESSTSDLLYCPAVPPDLRESSLFRRYWR